MSPSLGRSKSAQLTGELGSHRGSANLSYLLSRRELQLKMADCPCGLIFPLSSRLTSMIRKRGVRVLTKRDKETEVASESQIVTTWWAKEQLQTGGLPRKGGNRIVSTGEPGFQGREGRPLRFSSERQPLCHTDRPCFRETSKTAHGG